MIQMLSTRILGPATACSILAMSLMVTVTHAQSVPVYRSESNTNDTRTCGPPPDSQAKDQSISCRESNGSVDNRGCLQINKTSITCGQDRYFAFNPNSQVPDIVKAASQGGPNAGPTTGPRGNVVATTQASTINVGYTQGFYPKATASQFSMWNLTATVSTPISKTSDITAITTQDGLTNATALDFELSWYRDNWQSGSDRSTLVGLYIKPAYQQYTYITTASVSSEQTLEKKLMSANLTTGKVQGSAGTFVGHTLLGPDMIFGSYEYQHTYKDQTAGTLCPSAGSQTAVITCATGPVGAPALTDKSLISLEYKYYWDSSLPVAFDFNAIYDSKSHIASIDLPIYFVNSGKKAQLTGGLDIGWSSSNHKPSFGVVVSAPFTLLRPRT